MLYPCFLLLEYIWYLWTLLPQARARGYSWNVQLGHIFCILKFSARTYFQNVIPEYVALFINFIKILQYSLNETHTSLIGHAKAVLYLSQIPPQHPLMIQVLAILLLNHSVLSGCFWSIRSGLTWHS